MQEPAPDQPEAIAVAAVDGAELHVRIEPRGPSAERAVAAACAQRAGLARDPDAPLGAPAAHAACAGGEEALEHLVASAALALDEIDLHLTIRRA